MKMNTPLESLHQSSPRGRGQAQARTRARPVTIELAYGLGVSAKGIQNLPFSLKEYSHHFLSLVSETLSDSSLLDRHWNRFYWTSLLAQHTSENTFNTHRATSAERSLQERIESDRQFYDRLRSLTHQGAQGQAHSRGGGGGSESLLLKCNFNELKIQTTKSHILYTLLPSHSLSVSETEEANDHCLQFLMTVAVLQDEISFVSVTYGETMEGMTERTNAPYQEAAPATDQNSWVQSGTATETPYSDIGIDGTGYLLGMIGMLPLCVCLCLSHCLSLPLPLPLS
jgi:hypothetical protein